MNRILQKAVNNVLEKIAGQPKYFVFLPEGHQDH